MLTKTNKEKILELFFDDPVMKINLRELAKKSNLSPAGTLKIINQLKKEGFLRIEEDNVQKIITLDNSKSDVIAQKRLSNLTKIYESNIISYLNQIFEEPKAIVLFGSYSFGTDTKKSDIDIAVFASKERKDTDLSEFEKALKREIQLFIINEKTPKELLMSIYNGIVLMGMI